MKKRSSDAEARIDFGEAAALERLAVWALRYSPIFALDGADAALLVLSTAFAQSVGEKTGVNSALGISPATADFVKERR